MPITSNRLSWKEIQRLLDIMIYAPLQSKEGDAELAEKTGLFYIDEDLDIFLSEGALDAFFEYSPNARVRECWRGVKYLPYERESIAPHYYEYQASKIE